MQGCNGNCVNACCQVLNYLEAIIGYMLEAYERDSPEWNVVASLYDELGK